MTANLLGFGFLSLCFGRIDTDPFPVAAEFFIGDHAVNFGKQGIIPAQANITAGMNFRPKLPNQDISSPYDLTAIFFDTTPLGVTVSAVS